MLRRTGIMSKIPKGTWVDLRNHSPRRPGHNYIGDHAVCKLTYCRFSYQEDYELHLESKLYQDRVRWKEEMEHYRGQSKKKYHQHVESEWQSYVNKVLTPKSQKTGRPIEELMREARRAVVIGHSEKITPPVDVPVIKDEIKEPRDQRWPHQKHF